MKRNQWSLMCVTLTFKGCQLQQQYQRPFSSTAALFFFLFLYTSRCCKKERKSLQQKILSFFTIIYLAYRREIFLKDIFNLGNKPIPNSSLLCIKRITFYYAQCRKKSLNIFIHVRLRVKHHLPLMLSKIKGVIQVQKLASKSNWIHSFISRNYPIN